MKNISNTNSLPANVDILNDLSVGASINTTNIYTTNIDSSTTNTAEINTGELVFFEIPGPKISLYGPILSNTDYYGLGIGASETKYQVPSTSNNHTFYAGSTEVLKITGGGDCKIKGSLIGGINITTYYMTSSFPWPDVVDTSPGNWSAGPSVGAYLTNTVDGTFQNNLGHNCWVQIIWTAVRNSNTFGPNDYWIREDITGDRWGSVTNGGIEWATMTATLRLNNGHSFTLFGKQSSGTGNNFSTLESRLSIQIFKV